MRLKRLTLKNVCQHESLDFKFKSGLVGIFGPNGSGKSNAMNVACYAGITNDYSRHPLGKAGFVRQQSGENENSSIKVVFEHDGCEVAIERGLRAPVRQRMTIDGDRELRKAGEIQEMLEGALGVGKQLIDQYMFVGQDALYAFLSETPATRAKSLAQLCGTTFAERCWELAGEFIELDRGLVSSDDDNRDAYRAGLVAARENLKNAEAELVKCRENMLEPAEVEDLGKFVRRAEDAIRLRSEFPAAEAREKECLAAAKAAKKRWSALDKESAESAAALEELRTDREKLREAARIFSRDKQNWEKRLAKAGVVSSFKSHLAAAEEELKSKPDPGSCEDLRRALIEAQVERRRLKELLATLDAEGVVACPTCGTPTVGMTSLADARERVVELDRYVPEATAAVGEHEQKAAAFADLSRRVAGLRSKLEQAEVEFKDYADYAEPKPRDDKELAAVDAKWSGAEAKKMGLGLQASAVRGEFDRAVGQHQAAKDALAAKREHLAKVEAGGEVSPERLEEARLKLKTHEEAEKESFRHEAAVEYAGRERDSLQAQLDRETARLERRDKAASWVRDLIDVRDNVLHRDKLPALVHRRALERLQFSINKHLEEFESPFYARASDDLSFVADFADGASTPAQGLSGGQKVMLAIAFRLAVNSLFAEQAGMMVLDEPTDGLDADNRRLAAGVFRRLGTVAKERGQQIVVITHDEALRSAFDQSFDLS